jgi:hypothetical protein
MNVLSTKQEMVPFICLGALILLMSACNHEVPQPAASNGAASPANQPAGAAAGGKADANQIVGRYTALDNSHGSVAMTRASIQGVDNGSHLEIQMTMYRKNEPGGRRLMLVEFTSPPDERDRDALISVSAQGDIEATRFVQSTGSFITAKNATDQDSLFGLTLQEMVGGQNEKYDYKADGEDSYQSTPVYRVTGELKPGAESRFPRITMLISKDNFEALSIEAYDSHGDVVRRLIVNKLDQISGYWTRMSWTVENLEQKKKIVFQSTDVKYDQNIPDSTFTRDHLKVIASR